MTVSPRWRLMMTLMTTARAVRAISGSRGDHSFKMACGHVRQEGLAMWKLISAQSGAIKMVK